VVSRPRRLTSVTRTGATTSAATCPEPSIPELFTRWVQFGAFSPILRTHTTKNPESERRIWAYPEPYSSILRSTFRLRYALEPYLYTEARRTYDTGVAFLRPLYYDSPEEAGAYDSKGEYLFGDNMLVAPVTAPAERSAAWPQKKSGCPQASGSSGPRASTSQGQPPSSAASPSSRHLYTCAPGRLCPCSRPCATRAKNQWTR